MALWIRDMRLTPCPFTTIETCLVGVACVGSLLHFNKRGVFQHFERVAPSAQENHISCLLEFLIR